jgi:glycosyltransferase involved in cell wall biosynthesis
MQKNPLVTVICLCYNHADFVVESLHSIVNQSYKNIELIVVDDCSSDNSVLFIRNWLVDFPNVKLIVNQKNLGSTKSFNKALKIAKGDYIFDLAADDVLLPYCIEKQLECFDNSHFDNLGIVYGNAENISENGQFLSYYLEVDTDKKVINPRITGNIYKSILTSGDGLCSVAALVKKSVYIDLNGYDENLVYEDLDFWIRATRKYNVDFIDTILVQKRTVSTSLGNQFFKKNHKINQSTYLILRKAFGLNKNKEEDLALQTRVHYEIYYCLKNRIFGLLLKNLGLKIRLFFRVFTSNY